MRRTTLPVPTSEEIMSYDNVPPAVAARFIGWSSPTIYRALQEGRAPFGFAVECEKSWAYNISPGLLLKYKNGDLPTYRLTEVETLAAEGIARILDAKLTAMRQAAVAAL